MQFQVIGNWYNDRYYDFKVIQHPVRARQSGFGDKDRRPLAPALVLQLHVSDTNRNEIPLSDIIPHMLVAACDIFLENGDDANLVLHPAFGGSATNSVTRTVPEYGGVYGANGQRQSDLPVPRHAKMITFESYPPSRRSNTWPAGDPLYNRPPQAQQPHHHPQLPQLPQVPQVPQPTQAPQSRLLHPEYEPKSDPPAAVLPSIRTFEALGPPNQDAVYNRPYTQPGTSSWGQDNQHSRYDQPGSGSSWDSDHRPPRLHIDTSLRNINGTFNQPQTAPAAAGGLQYPRAQSQYDTVPMSGRSDTYTYNPVWQERQWANASRHGQSPTSSYWPAGAHRPENNNQLPSLGSALLREPPLKKYSRTLIGPLTANGVLLQDDKKRDGVFFIFSDLSVRVEGVFRIRIRLFPIVLPKINLSTGRSKGSEKSPMLAMAWSEPFEVYSAKRFPGVPEITPLSQALSAQGQKLPTRRKNDEHDDDRFNDDRLTNAWPDDFDTT